MASFSDLLYEVSVFLRDIESEVRRITWPTRQETIKSTMAVIVVSGVFTLFFAATDYLFSMVVGSILS